jgi:O-acetylserine/cysteine efflux transporter
VALVVVLAGVYAVCYSAIKAGLSDAPPLRFGGLRALLGGALLLGLLAARRQSLRPPRWTWPWIAVLAATGIVVGYGAMFSSPGLAGAGLASVVGNMGPLLMTALAWLVLKERMTTTKTAALILGAVGVVIIANPGRAGAGSVGIAALSVPLLAALGTASESVLFKRARIGREFLSVAAWQLVLGGVVLLALSAWLERDHAVEWTPRFAGLLAFLGAVGTALALGLWYWLVQQDELSRLGILLYATPVLGLAVAVVLLGERPGARALLGAVVTVAGIALLARRDEPIRDLKHV